MSDEDLFGSGDEGDKGGETQPMEVTGASSEAKGAGADDDDDENLFGSDNEEETGWVDAPKTEEEKLEAILGSEGAGTGAGGVQVTKTAEKKETVKGKMFLEKTHKLSTDKNSLLFVKTPTFLKIQPKEYEEASFDADAERTEFGPLTSDVIRWRFKTDADGNKVLDHSGKPVMESNARLQKLKNGKYQVVIGSNVFDSNFEDMEKNYLYMSNLSAPPTDGSGLTDEEEGKGVNLNESTNLTMASTMDGARRMIIQPRLGSKTHAHMNQAITKKYRKQDRMGVRDVRDIVENPDATMEKEEREERARLLNERKGRDPDRASGYSRRGDRDSRIGMSSDYLNEDNDDTQYDEINLSDIKSGKGKKKKANSLRRSSRGRLGELDEDEEDGDDDADDDEEDSDDQDGDDDDLDGFIVKGDDDEEGDDEGESDDGDQPRYFKKGDKNDKKSKQEKDGKEGDDSDSDLFASDEEPEMPNASKRALENKGGDDGAAAEGGGGGDNDAADGAPKKRARKGVVAGDSDDE